MKYLIIMVLFAGCATKDLMVPKQQEALVCPPAPVYETQICPEAPKCGKSWKSEYRSCRRTTKRLYRAGQKYEGRSYESAECEKDLHECRDALDGCSGVQK